MTDKLIERLEKLSEPDRELDADICEIALGLKRLSISQAGGRDRFQSPDNDFLSVAAPFYTASIDAALELVPEGYAIEHMLIWPNQPSPVYIVGTKLGNDGNYWHSSNDGRWSAKAATPAIAICIASLRARQHEAVQ